MQAVSPTFSGAMNAPWRQLDFGVLISWNKQVASGINYFTIGQSVIGGTDIIATSQPGTIAQANAYAYQSIPASGVVSWETSLRLDQYPYGMVQRQANVVLNNAGEQYLPASGTQFGPSQLPGRPMIISAGFGQETIPMFTGFSDTPVNDIKARTTTLHGYDAITYINSFKSTATKPFVNQTVNTIIAAGMAEMGFGANQYVLELSLNTTIPYLDPYGQYWGQIIQQLCEAEAAIFFADEGGILHFWNREHFSNNATPVYTLTYSNMENLSQQTTSIINSVEIQSAPLSLLSGVQNVYSLNQPYYIQAGSYSGINAYQNPSVESNTAMWVTSGVRQNQMAASGNWALSGTQVIYSGVPVRDVNGNIYYNDGASGGGGLYHFQGSISAQLKVYAERGTAFFLQLIEPSNVGNSPIVFSNSFYTGIGAWQTVGFTYQFSNYSNVFFNLGDVRVTISGTHTGNYDYNRGFIVDAISDFMTASYFDGNTPNTGVNTFSWSGAANNSASIMGAIPQYLAIQVNLGFETFSLVPPVASGLNAANIAAQQSFFSFSSLSGTGGIFGTDLTANMALQAYSVSGSTAWLIWQNTGTTQAYLTNLQLYGTVADSPSNSIDETFSDATSITAYGLNPSNAGQVVNINNNFVPTATYAQSLAQYLVSNFKTPYLRHTTDNYAIPPLQFGDACTLVNRDTGESRVAFLMGIVNRMDKDASFKQQLIFQERTIQNYFTINVSTIGGPSVIAP